MRVWLAHVLLNSGDHARCGAWIARARRLLGEAEHDRVEQGYLLLPVALQHIDEGDAARATETLRQVIEIAS